MLNDANGQQEALLPKNVQRYGFWLSLIGSLMLFTYFVIYIVGYVEVAPKDLGLANIFLFSLACFMFFSIPWHNLGLGLRRFGPLEFERKLKGQSEERIKDIAALEEKIEKLEEVLGRPPGAVHYVDKERNRKVSDFKALIVAFLREFDDRAFSPRRIENWGAQQPGYSELSGNSELLRTTLRRLVVEGTVETSVSQRGNTLYRIKK